MHFGSAAAAENGAPEHFREAKGGEAKGAKSNYVASQFWTYPLFIPELEADDDLSEDVMRRVLWENREKLDRFLYNWKELKKYSPPSGKEIAARLGMHEGNVSRVKEQIETEVKKRLRRRWCETAAGRARNAGRQGGRA